MEGLDCDGLASLLKRKGLRPHIADRLKCEGFDGSNFLDTSATLLVALSIKGAEIAAIQLLQNVDTFKDITENHEALDRAVEFNQSNEDANNESNDEDAVEGADVAAAREDLQTFFSEQELQAMGSYDLLCRHNNLQRYRTALASDLRCAEMIRPSFVPAPKAAPSSKRSKSRTKQKQAEVPVAATRVLRSRKPGNEPFCSAADVTSEAGDVLDTSGGGERNRATCNNYDSENSSSVSEAQNDQNGERGSPADDTNVSNNHPNQDPCCSREDGSISASVGMSSGLGLRMASQVDVASSSSSQQNSAPLATSSQDPCCSRQGGSTSASISASSSQGLRMTSQVHIGSSCSSEQNPAPLATGSQDSRSSRQGGSTGVSSGQGLSTASHFGSTSNVQQILPPLATSSSKGGLPLPQYDVVTILRDRLLSDENDKKGKDTMKKLGNNMLLSREERKRVIRIITQHLHTKLVGDPKHVTPLMKEGMAKSFVDQYPMYKNTDNADENSQPWHHVYHPASRGWIANASRSFQKKNRVRKSKPSKDSDKDSDGELMDDDAIEQLAELMPGRQEKMQILDGMTSSFPIREEDRKKGMSIKAMLEKFPHLKHYEGEVLKEEFRQLQPRAEDMCRLFNKLLPKMLSLPRHREFSLNFPDDVLKALMLLSHNLPHDIPMNLDGNVSHTWAVENDVVEVVKGNQDIDSFIMERLEKASGPVQPYLLLVQSPVTKNVLRVFLVLDSQPVQLPTTVFLKSLDWLFKSYFVFHVRYPFGWRNVFHFLQTCFYKIRVVGGKPDRMSSSEFELWKRLNSSDAAQ